MSDPADNNMADAMETWYYGTGDDSFSAEFNPDGSTTGNDTHGSRVLWRASMQMGCAVFHCPGNDKSGSFSVMCHFGNGVSWNQVSITSYSFVVDKLNPHHQEEIRWYLEDYAERSPFETSRATAAAKVLADHGAKLASGIEWDSILGPLGHNQPLVIHVREKAPQNPRSSSRHAFWELLE